MLLSALRYTMARARQYSIRRRFMSEAQSDELAAVYRGILGTLASADVEAIWTAILFYRSKNLPKRLRPAANALSKLYDEIGQNSAPRALERAPNSCDFFQVFSGSVTVDRAEAGTTLREGERLVLRRPIRGFEPRAPHFASSCAWLALNVLLTSCRLRRAHVGANAAGWRGREERHESGNDYGRAPTARYAEGKRPWGRSCRCARC